MNTQPTNLDEVVDLIIEDIKKQGGQETVIKEGIPHHGAGTAIRNNLQLWWQPNWVEERVNGKGEIEEVPVPKPPLVQWFNDKNIFHADDISGTITAAVEAKLKGEPFDVDKHLRRYFEHWKKAGFKNGIYTPGKQKKR